VKKRGKTGAEKGNGKKRYFRKTGGSSAKQKGKWISSKKALGRGEERRTDGKDVMRIKGKAFPPER